MMRDLVASTRLSLVCLMFLPCSALSQGLLPEQVTVWANVYIPDDTDNQFISDHVSGSTVVSDPLRVYCYGTDGRGPSDDRDASSRVHSLVVLELTNEEPWVNEIDREMRIGETVEYGCATADVSCNATGSFDEDEIGLTRDGNLLQIKFDLASGNPCNFFAENFGAIDFEALLTIDLLKREFAYEGRIADFPNYELYLQYDSDDPITVIDHEISDDSSPLSLLGGASKNIEGSGTID